MTLYCNVPDTFAFMLFNALSRILYCGDTSASVEHVFLKADYTGSPCLRDRSTTESTSVSEVQLS